MAKKHPLGETYRATVSGLSASCRLAFDGTHATLFYPRHTRLGKRLAAGLPDPTRLVLANYIRQEKGWPRGEANALPISFVGV